MRRARLGSVLALAAAAAAFIAPGAAVLRTVRQKAPNARVFVVGYPQILPDRGRGCWPTLPIAFGDVAYLREKTKELNAMLQTQASAARVGFIDTYGPSEGHSSCASPTTRWVEPLVPANAAAPVHPNASGMAGIAAVVGPVVQ